MNRDEPKIISIQWSAYIFIRCFLAFVFLAGGLASGQPASVAQPTVEAIRPLLPAWNKSLIEGHGLLIVNSDQFKNTVLSELSGIAEGGYSQEEADLAAIAVLSSLEIAVFLSPDRYDSIDTILEDLGVRLQRESSLAGFLDEYAKKTFNYDWVRLDPLASDVTVCTISESDFASLMQEHPYLSDLDGFAGVGDTLAIVSLSVMDRSAQYGSYLLFFKSSPEEETPVVATAVVYRAQKGSGSIYLKPPEWRSWDTLGYSHGDEGVALVFRGISTPEEARIRHLILEEARAGQGISFAHWLPWAGGGLLLLVVLWRVFRRT